MNQKKRRRNRGTIDGIVLPVPWSSQDGRRAEHRQLELRHTKEEIEEDIARATFRRFDKLRELGDRVRSPYPTHQIDRPRRGERPREDDIDFEFTGVSGEYLDVTEYTPHLEELYGNYGRAPKEYVVGERASEVERRLRDDKCSASRYGRDVAKGLHVLLYVTDWKMSLDEGLVQLLRASFNRDAPDVRSIVFFRPNPGDESDGQVALIYPHPPEDIDEDAIRQTKVWQGLPGVDPNGRPVVRSGEGAPVPDFRIDRMECEDTGEPPYRVTLYVGPDKFVGYTRSPTDSVQILHVLVYPDDD